MLEPAEKRDQSTILTGPWACQTSRLPMKTTVPDLCCLMYGRTALVTLMSPKKFTWNCSKATFDLCRVVSRRSQIVSLRMAAYPPSSMTVLTP